MRTRPSSTRAVGALALLLVCAACGETAPQGEPAARKPPVQHFVSRADLRPPPVHVVVAAHGTAPGYIFIAPKKEVEQAGPLILDDRGQVVWFHPLDTHGVTDFRVQRYRGKPVLTWWRGGTGERNGHGGHGIFHDAYHPLPGLPPGAGVS